MNKKIGCVVFGTMENRIRNQQTNYHNAMNLLVDFHVFCV